MFYNKRIVLHLLFWIVYFAVSLYNELFLSSSFTNNPSLTLIGQAVISQLLTMTIKVPLVYILIYYLIPKWFAKPNKSLIILEGAGIFLVAAILHRIIIQQIVWIYIYNSTPPDFTILQQTARLIYSLLDLLQISGIAAVIKLIRMRLKAMVKEKQLVQGKLQAEMQHLKSQINPHFLFNSLNTIFSLTRSKSDDAPNAVMLLSSILRHMIYDTEKKTISLAGEIKIIDDYIELQKLRFGKKVTVNRTYEISDDSVMIAPLLLLPLVENAFKHGISNQSGNTEIAIKIDQKKDRFEFVISNPAGNGKRDIELDEGIGLSNIERQLQLLYRDSSLSYGMENNIFIVNLKISLDTYAGIELFDRGG